ncbi:MAG: outer membrane protein transport protein [Aquificaceae bacterium]|nr:outer membrane protein transport protein [Aquificaceae bacterium]MDW8096799.1 outer membrane protein transport protein [Aquificaceae bacterium]
MRKSLLLVFLAFGVSFATNGDNLIGVSPASRGMGGIGVGTPVGPTDALFKNPAWMNYYKGFNVSFGGILFAPQVKAKNNATPMGPMNPPASERSRADLFVVPEVGIVQQVSKELSFGVGAFGVSGMGVDYRNKDPRLANIHTNFQFMRLIPTVSYKVSEALSVAGALHLAYGSLDMGANLCDPTNPTRCWNAGGGQSQNYGIGFQLGVAYNMGDFVYLGAAYQSPVAMTYRRVFDSNGDGRFEDFKLTQPQELALGVGARPLENLKVGLDLRWINWKGARGYKEFQWRDQLVLALGAEYKPMEKLALRGGYNFGRSPIKGGVKNPLNANRIPSFAAPFSDFQIAYFNLVAFPAISEQHITLGLGYEFTKNFSVDLAYKHAFNKKVRATDPSGALLVEAQNAQNALSVGLNWKF